MAASVPIAPMAIPSDAAASAGDEHPPAAHQLLEARLGALEVSRTALVHLDREDIDLTVTQMNDKKKPIRN